MENGEGPAGLIHHASNTRWTWGELHIFKLHYISLKASFVFFTTQEKQFWSLPKQAVCSQPTEVSRKPDLYRCSGGAHHAASSLGDQRRLGRFTINLILHWVY